MTTEERFEFYIYIIIFLSILVLLIIQLIIIRIAKRNYLTNEKLNKLKFIKLLKIIINTIDDLEYNKSWINDSSYLLNIFRVNYIIREKSRIHIAKELLNLHRVLGGNAAKRLEDIYYHLGLDKTGVKYLRKKDSKLQATVIRDFAQMNVTWALPEIRNLLNHTNETVRSEALIATLQLGDVNIVSETESIGNLSDWYKLKIVDAAKHIELQNLPNLTNALYSKSDLVVELALNLVVFYKVKVNNDIIKKHLNSKNNTIIKLCLSIIINNSDKDLINELFIIFQDIDDDEKVNILKEIKPLDYDLFSDHLMKIVYDTNKADRVRLEALRSAYKMSINNNMSFEIKIDSIDKDKLDRMYKHAIDKYI